MNSDNNQGPKETTVNSDNNQETKETGMNSDNNQAGSRELVELAKTWLQRDDRFPIDFNDIWKLAGYTLRENAARAFRECIRNFNLTEGLEYSSFKTEIQSGAGRPSKSWKITVGAAKRFLASAQTKEGFRTIEALIQADEELQAIKKNLAGMIDQTILQKFADLAEAQAKTNETLVKIQKDQTGIMSVLVSLVDRLAIVEEKVIPQGMSMEDLLESSGAILTSWESVRDEYRLMYPNVYEADIQAKRSFGRMLSTAGRQANAIVPKQNGLTMYNERKIPEIVAKLEKPVTSFRRRTRNRYKPLDGQQNFLDEN